MVKNQWYKFIEWKQVTAASAGGLVQTQYSI